MYSAGIRTAVMGRAAQRLAHPSWSCVCGSTRAAFPLTAGKKRRKSAWLPLAVALVHGMAAAAGLLFGLRAVSGKPIWLAVLQADGRLLTTRSAHACMHVHAPTLSV